MQQIRLKLDYLYGFGDAGQPVVPVTVESISTLLKQYLPFLPDPTRIDIQGDEVELTFDGVTESRRQEAKRLAGKAVERAKKGEYVILIEATLVRHG